MISLEITNPAHTHADLVLLRDLPDHVHHKNDVEDNEEVVRVPEDLIVGHPKKANDNNNTGNYF